MKTAFVVRQFPSVSQTFVLNQVVGLLQRGVDVTVFAVPPVEGAPIHGDARQEDLLDRVRYRPALPSRGPARYLARARWLARNTFRGALRPLACSRSFAEGLRALPFHLRVASRPLVDSRERFDVVHAHFGPLGALAALSREIHGLRGPIVVSMHAYDITAYPRRYGSGIYRHLFSAAHRLLPISHRGETLLEELGCPRRKLTVHRMGIDTLRFPYRAPRLDANRELKLLSVGRLVEKKGFEYGIRATAHLRGSLDVRYTIIGDGPLQARLTSVVNDVDMGSHVSFTGWKPHEEVLAAMEAADVLVVPSVTATDGNEEGIPMVIMEAMAMGLPVVTTPTGAINELVEDGRTGRLVPQRSPSAIADAVRGLCRMAAADLEVMTQAARSAVEESHDLARLNDRLVSLYEEVARSAARGPVT